MRDYKHEIAVRIAALESAKEAGLEEAGVYALIEIPQDTELGDFAFPCFRLAKALKKAPQAIAAGLEEEWDAAPQPLDGGPVRCRAAGPYLNFFLDRAEYIGDVVRSVLEEGARFGGSELGAGRRMLVEYSSPNIAKPFHIGHIRSTVIGSAIGNIFEFLGYDVLRLNHLGDYGTQFGKLIVAYRRFGCREDVEASPITTLLDYYVKFHKLAEEDPSLEVEARAAFSALERGEEEEAALWEWFREESLKEFTVVYDMMGIRFDSFDGESFYSDKMGRFTQELERDGLLEESDGAQIVDLEGHGLGKALIKKSDGSTLYITRDIAAAVYRKEHYGFYRNIYVVASQQDLHFKQWIKILDLMGYEWAGDCVHVPFGLVRLADGAMSTRTGNVVFLEDVLRQAVDKTKEIIGEKGIVTDDIDETARQIGIGAVVFQELHNNRIKDYEFDWSRVLNFDGETGPYAQYSHARAASILRKAGELGLDVSPGALSAAGGYDAIASDAVFALAKLTGALPRVVAEAGEKYEPSLITRHVADIAQAFSAFYHDEPILADEGEARQAKLALTAAVKQTIRNGLALLGISAPERM
ncbi:MAG: arginine--tRNA ligase [Clostridiales bacterium]|nr:arginine--tRNA ligase [Clostridiales bacterium]